MAFCKTASIYCRPCSFFTAIHSSCCCTFGEKYPCCCASCSLRCSPWLLGIILWDSQLSRVLWACLWIANCLHRAGLSQWCLSAHTVAELPALKWRLSIQGGKALHYFHRLRGFSATWYFRHLIAVLQLVCGNWDCLSKILSMCLCCTMESDVVHTHSTRASTDPHKSFYRAQLYVWAQMLI